jgi:uncharacterized protein YjbI with pentapeptide repeats
MTNYCDYTAPSTQSCQRPVWGGRKYCVFHQHLDTTIQVVGSQYPDEKILLTELNALIVQKDGNWRGFGFPTGFKLPRDLNFKIDARWSVFLDACFDAVTFKQECDFSESKFIGHTLLKNCVFENRVDFVKCTFDGDAEFVLAEFKLATRFDGAVFSGKLHLQAYFSEHVNFNACIFKDAVTFHGMSMQQDSWQSFDESSVLGKTANIYIGICNFVNNSKWQNKRLITKMINRPLFRKGVGMANVLFCKPEQTIFKQVNMSGADVHGTNFRGLRFIGVDWYQPKLNRNGLGEDWALCKGTNTYIPWLEESYRNIRGALEDNLDYVAAADFYVGEMEARRAQLNVFERNIFSVEVLYKTVSNYGTSITRATLVLLSLLILHWGISMLISFDTAGFDWDNALCLLQDSFYMLTFPALGSSGLQKWVDITFKLLELLQMAMLIFAFRTKIKRY